MTRPLLDGLDACIRGTGPGLGEAGELLAALGADITSVDGGRAPARGSVATASRACPGLWLSQVAGPQAAARAEVVAVYPPGLAVDGPAAEQELAERCGLAALSGETGGPPLPPPAGVVSAVVGAQLATAGLAAILASERTGEPERIEVDIGAAVMSAISPILCAIANSGRGWPRLGNRSLGLTPGIVAPCRDGHVLVGVGNDQDWATLGRMCGLDDGSIARFASAEARRVGAVKIGQLLEPWLRARTRDEVFQAGQAVRLPFAPALSPDEAAREVPVVEWGLSSVRNGQTGPALPSLDEAAAGADGFAPAGRIWSRPRARAPLAGLRVLDLTSLWSGPYAGFMLAALGAEVIKIEAPQRPDGTRGPAAPGASSRHLYAGGDPAGQPRNRNCIFNDLNRGKLGLTLNLATPAGLHLFRQLAQSADLVLDNYTPRVLDNFGLDVDELIGSSTHLAWLSMPGFGLAGPYRDFVALGSGFEMLSGLAFLTGHDHGDGRPHLLGYPITDCLAGIHAAAGALALLRSGRPARLVVPQLASARHLVQAGARRPGRPPAVAASGVSAVSPEEIGRGAGDSARFERVHHDFAGGQLHLRLPWPTGRARHMNGRRAPQLAGDSSRVLERLAGIDRRAFGRLRDRGISSAPEDHVA